MDVQGTFCLSARPREDGLIDLIGAGLTFYVPERFPAEFPLLVGLFITWELPEIGFSHTFDFIFRDADGGTVSERSITMTPTHTPYRLPGEAPITSGPVQLPVAVEGPGLYSLDIFCRGHLLRSLPLRIETQRVREFRVVGGADGQ